MGPFSPFQTLVKFVDVEDNTSKIFRILDLPLEIINVTKKLEYKLLSAQTVIQILESSLHKQLIRIKTVKLNFPNGIVIVINPITLSQINLATK